MNGKNMSFENNEIEDAKHKSFETYMKSPECTSFTRHVYSAGWDAAINFLKNSYHQTLTAFMKDGTHFVHVDMLHADAKLPDGCEPLYTHNIRMQPVIPESDGERELLQGIINIIYSLNKNAHITHLDNVACDVLNLINKTYQSKYNDNFVGYAVPDFADIMAKTQRTLIVQDKTDLHKVPVYTNSCPQVCIGKVRISQMEGLGFMYHFELPDMEHKTNDSWNNWVQETFGGVGEYPIFINPGLKV